MQKMSKEQAVAFLESGQWKDLTDEEITRLQLFQERRCVPADVFQRAIEGALGRPVLSAEYKRFDELTAEFEGRAERPTLTDVVRKLIDRYGDKVVIVNTEDH